MQLALDRFTDTIAVPKHLERLAQFQFVLSGT